MLTYVKDACTSILGTSFKTYKENAIQIAKDLEYSKSVLEAIELAHDEYEISRILHDARNGVKRSYG